MGYFISQDGSYHEGDELIGDVAVSQRPDAFHAWSGSAWVYAATETDYLAEVGRWLDTTVQERFYDNIVSACSYAASTNAKFKAEADACVAWRDAVYVACYAALAAVQAGTMEQPTVEAFIASLPQLTWPS
jgi:hypothetical protein